MNYFILTLKYYLPYNVVNKSYNNFYRKMRGTYGWFERYDC